MLSKEVLIVCQYSQEPPYNTMLRYHNWGKELVKRGYVVNILTSSVVHNTNIDIIETINADNSFVDGVHYHYIKTKKYQGNGIKRILNMFEFCVGIKKKKKLFKPVFVIVCGAYPYKFVAKNFPKSRIIVDIVDLWPLSIVEYANVNPRNPFIRYLYHLEKVAYLKSDALVFSMEGGVDYVKEQKYASKIDESKIFHINMGIDLKSNDFNKKNQIIHIPWDSSHFNIGYCGSIRRANNVKQICDAALEIQKKGLNDIRFQIYGNGDELDCLKQYCKDKSIKNINFYGRIQKEHIPFVLSKMEANILTYKQVNLMKYGGSQSKLFDYLAAGKPIICNAVFGHNLITRYNCGLITQKQDSASFLECVEKLYKMSSSERQTMGKNARKTAELYDLPKLVDLLERVFVFLNKR